MIVWMTTSARTSTASKHLRSSIPLCLMNLGARQLFSTFRLSKQAKRPRHVMCDVCSSGCPTRLSLTISKIFTLPKLKDITESPRYKLGVQRAEMRAEVEMRASSSIAPHLQRTQSRFAHVLKLRTC